MTEPNDPQPQPVINAGGWAGLAMAIVGTTLTILVAARVITPADQQNLITAFAPLITAVAGIVSVIIAALHTRKRVTPLARPRDAKGRRLVPVDERHAAKDTDSMAAAMHRVASAGLHAVIALRDLQHVTDALTGRVLNPDDTQAIPIVARHIPEKPVAGKRLGRHVNHDPRSLSYLIPETDSPTTAMWTRRVPVFDQGDLGSCTGNAAAGVLGTSPFYETLPAGLTDDENEAVSLYSAATKLDDYSGAYPPDDTGSDGLSVAKACQKAGLISGYQHITSVAAAQTAIKTGPFIVGVNWYSSMDKPDANGLVKVSGTVRGGHEFECHGYDADADLWWFTNSWGPDWGKDGTFCMSSASFARLLSEDGDATVFLPVAAPFPPVPPAPAPGPAPAPAPAVPADWVSWAKHTLTLKEQTRATVKVATEIVEAAQG